jgi:DNA-binding phage protein
MSRLRADRSKKLGADPRFQANGGRTRATGSGFRQALLDEAATLFLNGEPETARLILRDLVNATVGFEALAAATARLSKSLHRMLSKSGNPSMDNLAAIFDAVRKQLRVSLQAQAVKAA